MKQKRIGEEWLFVSVCASPSNICLNRNSWILNLFLHLLCCNITGQVAMENTSPLRENESEKNGSINKKIILTCRIPE